MAKNHRDPAGSVKRVLGQRERWSKEQSINSIIGGVIGPARNEQEVLDNLRAGLAKLPHSMLREIYDGMFGADAESAVKYDYEPDEENNPVAHARAVARGEA